MTQLFLTFSFPFHMLGFSDELIGTLILLKCTTKDMKRSIHMIIVQDRKKSMN